MPVVPRLQSALSVESNNDQAKVNMAVSEAWFPVLLRPFRQPGVVQIVIRPDWYMALPHTHASRFA